uniref:Tripartite motif-containing protein 5-like n=1 Tax=Equus asinus TaxID=9793 RepID=A0A8C4KW64_EQUAS|nr:E3 ubiquitin-protein ligase TRIM22-like [Equus asinus]XP_044609316.1 E3 ubiquitin-protein ligase TRIM22-like [Equus asinus]
MASGILVNIKEEVTCPICLELLTEPLSLDCGHSFCQACITTKNKESKIDQGGEGSCPVCRITYQPVNMRPNRHVANIVERLKEVKLSPEEGQKRDLCVHHEEKLRLFCKEDGKVICWLCERSQEHRRHQTFLMDEVAQEYQKKLQETLQRLRAGQREAEELEANIREKRTAWKNQIQNERQSVQAEFKQMRGILDSEEQKELHKLASEEGTILQNLAESEKELVEQRHLMTTLISDVERRLQGSTLEMLQDVSGIMKRSETLTLRQPKPLPMEQRRVFRAPDPRGILRVFNELTDMRRYWVHMTLDPVKSKSTVSISAYRGQVKPNIQAHWGYNYDLYGFQVTPTENTYENGNDDDCGFLGSLVINSGKHYWEVDVSGKTAWILGVYSRIYSGFNLKVSSKQGKNYQNSYTRYQPKHGYWVIGLRNHSEYNAFENSSSSDPLILTLSLTIPPRRVGIFLDYKAGTVSFFNVTNYGFLIYKFSSCHFSQDVFPYFNCMTRGARMTVCLPSS